MRKLIFYLMSLLFLVSCGDYEEEQVFAGIVQYRHVQTQVIYNPGTHIFRRNIHYIIDTDQQKGYRVTKSKYDSLRPGDSLMVTKYVKKQ